MFCFRCGADINETDETCPNCHAQLGTQIEERRSSKSAPFLKRALAFCLDLILLLLLFTFVNAVMRVLAVYIFPLVILGYLVMGWTSEKQATMGMSLQGIKITDAKTGGKVGTGKAIARSILMLVSVGAVLIGCLVMFFNKSGQMLHDLITNTAVICIERTE